MKWETEEHKKIRCIFYRIALIVAQMKHENEAKCTMQSHKTLGLIVLTMYSTLSKYETQHGRTEWSTAMHGTRRHTKNHTHTHTSLRFLWRWAIPSNEGSETHKSIDTDLWTIRAVCVCAFNYVCVIRGVHVVGKLLSEKPLKSNWMEQTHTHSDTHKAHKTTILCLFFSDGNRNSCTQW